MQKANDTLEEQRAADPESVNVEHVDDPEAQHIAMDLHCGLFEAKDGGADEDSSDGEDGMQDLKLPSEATAAVSAAARAGRTLISELPAEASANSTLSAESADRGVASPGCAPTTDDQSQSGAGGGRSKGPKRARNGAT